jgi:predicted TIM-barrel fold metal-dependent hydrolase
VNQAREHAVIADAHCHFFSSGFFAALGREAGVASGAAATLAERLGWETPGEDRQLAARWIAELDRHGVSRAMLIASVPGDEESVAHARGAYPDRIAGAFMVNPAAPDAAARVDRAFGELGLRTACLFPAMHLVAIDDERTAAIFAAAARHRRAVFVHCGVLSVGVRKKLDLPSRFDLRLGDPLAVAAVAARYPEVPVIIPHFGAGFFRQALIAASAAPNIHLDTSSSNSWIRFEPGMTLRDVFRRALDVAGASRLLFGTDSSFFPRGWQRGIYEEQRAVLTDLDVSTSEQELIFSGNFERVLGPGEAPDPRRS